MRLRFDFGINGTRREVTWWRDVSDLPTAFSFNGIKYEFFMYKKDHSKNYDLICTFAEMRESDPRWYNCKDFDQEFGYNSKTACECGSIYSSAAQFHMFYCPMWKKV